MGSCAGEEPCSGELNQDLGQGAMHPLNMAVSRGQRRWEEVTGSCMKDTVGPNAGQNPTILRFIFGGKYLFKLHEKPSKLTFLSELNLLTQAWVKQQGVLSKLSRIQRYVYSKAAPHGWGTELWPD